MLFSEDENENSEGAVQFGTTSALLDVSSSIRAAPVQDRHNQGDLISAV